MSTRLNLHAIRGVAGSCPTLDRLVSYLDDPRREESKVRESIVYHLTLAHPTCPALPDNDSANDTPEACHASAVGGYLRCWLPLDHDGRHESRLFIWT